VWAPKPFWGLWKRELSFAPIGFRIAYIPTRSLSHYIGWAGKNIRDWIKKYFYFSVVITCTSECEFFLFFFFCFYYKQCSFNILCLKNNLPLSQRLWHPIDWYSLDTFTEIVAITSQYVSVRPSVTRAIFLKCHLLKFSIMTMNAVRTFSKAVKTTDDLQENLHVGVRGWFDFVTETTFAVS
jgi:hypothetical protein